MPVPGTQSVLLVQSPLRDALATVELRAEPAAARGRARAPRRVRSRVRRRVGVRAAAPPARGGGRADRRRAVRRADPRRRRGRGRAARADVRPHAPAPRARSTTRGASSSRTPRTSCGRRCSRSAASSSCWTTRSSTRRRASEFLTTMREQVDRLDEARDRAARPLPGGRRPAAGRARAGRARRGRGGGRRRVRRGRARRATGRSSSTVESGLPVLGDEQRVLQIARDPGRERARAHTARHAACACDAAGSACSSVDDDGPGISAEHAGARVRPLLPRSRAGSRPAAGSGSRSPTSWRARWAGRSRSSRSPGGRCSGCSCRRPSPRDAEPAAH